MAAFAAPRVRRPSYTSTVSSSDSIDEALASVYFKYGRFGSTGNPSFRSREFVKIVREAGLMDSRFNIYPPNRVDFVYAYACVHGPGGAKGNKNMSLEQFAYATKGIAHETGRPHDEVLRALLSAEPQLGTDSLYDSPAASPVPSPRPMREGSPAAETFARFHEGFGNAGRQSELTKADVVRQMSPRVRPPRPPSSTASSPRRPPMSPLSAVGALDDARAWAVVAASASAPAQTAEWDSAQGHRGVQRRLADLETMTMPPPPPPQPSPVVLNGLLTGFQPDYSYSHRDSVHVSLAQERARTEAEAAAAAAVTRPAPASPFSPQPLARRSTFEAPMLRSS